MGKTARPRCFLPPRAFGSASGAAGGGRGSRGSRVTFQHLARSLGVAEEGFARRRQVRDAEAGSRHRAAADPAGRGGGGGGGHLGPAQPARGRKSRTGLGSWTFRPNLGLNCLNLGPGQRLQSIGTAKALLLGTAWAASSQRASRGQRHRTSAAATPLHVASDTPALPKTQFLAPKCCRPFCVPLPR